MPTDFGFFFPLVFSRCFSFASVVSPLAALRTSTSRRGRASARAWCSTNVAYSGLSWCRLTICAMMASESATKSSLDCGDDFRILSRSASAEPACAHRCVRKEKMTTRRRRRTLDSGGAEELRSVAEIGLELALLLEARLLARIEHRVLVVVGLAPACSKLRAARGLFLGKLLFERPFLLGRRRCCHRWLLLYLVIGGCLPVALR